MELDQDGEMRWYNKHHKKLHTAYYNFIKRMASLPRDEFVNEIHTLPFAEWRWDTYFHLYHRKQRERNKNFQQDRI